jgi:hypothetical protein
MNLMIVRIWSRLFETLLWYCLSPQTALRLSGVIKIKLLRSFSKVIADNHNFNGEYFFNGELREFSELICCLGIVLQAKRELNELLEVDYLTANYANLE